jgi:hypothetical protein
MLARVAPLLAALALAGGCGPSGPAAYLPPGSAVPSAYADLTLSAQIDAHDSVERLVPRVQAFAEGEPVAYWHFGELPDEGTMPLYRVCRREGTRCVPVDHPPVVEHLPGDDGYRHFGRVHEVDVSARWAGERMPSREAIDDAVRDGLVSAPRATTRYRHCPIVHEDVRVEVGPGETAAPVPVYAQGVEARCVDFGATHGDRTLESTSAATVLIRNVYVLTREGEDGPLIEAMRGEDLTGDGDLDDSNNVLAVGLANRDYTPVWSVVMVTVPASFEGIDTYLDQTRSDVMAATTMFTIDTDYRIAPIAGQVVDFEESGVLVDCPIQSAAGAL